MITIDLIPVSYGDTILISIEPEETSVKETHILVDCGMKYKPSILPVIKALSCRGKKLDRLIITHYDNDHIQSAAKFIKNNGNFTAPSIISIDQVWLNSFRHSESSKVKPIPTNKEETILLERFIAENSDLGLHDDEYEINAEQASFLGKELIAQGYPWNTDFKKKAICIENGDQLTINETVKITILSPRRSDLEALRDEFKAVLKKYNIAISDEERIDDAFELYVQQGGLVSDLPTGYEISAITQITSELITKMADGSGYKADTEIGNGSSIAFILEAEGKRILMLADAHAETVIPELERHFPDKSTYPLYFDAIKVGHHGSYRNNPAELYDIIDSELFLFSTNGLHQSHAHPDLQTIALIISRELTNDIENRRLVFNHKLDHLPGLDQKVLMDKFNYSVEVKTFIEL